MVLFGNNGSSRGFVLVSQKEGSLAGRNGEVTTRTPLELLDLEQTLVQPTVDARNHAPSKPRCLIRLPNLNTNNPWWCATIHVEWVHGKARAQKRCGGVPNKAEVSHNQNPGR